MWLVQRLVDFVLFHILYERLMLFYKTLHSHLNVFIVYNIYSEYELFSYFLQFKWDPIFMISQ